MQNCKQQILSTIPDNNCCSNAFFCAVLKPCAQIDIKTSSIIINCQTNVMDKLIKIVHNFYPHLEISVWENFLMLQGNLFNLLMDCGIDENLTFNFKIFDADCDKLALIKTLFLVSGNFYYTEDNSKNSHGYRLEFIVKPELKEITHSLLQEFGFKLRNIARYGSQVFYTTNSNTICDLLTKMGAVYTTLEIQNNLAIREIRNAANRQNNCFESNLDKTLSASAIQVNAIKFLMEKNYFDNLPDNLKDVALARIANPDISLSELQTILGEKISRAGIKYRLDKIIETYNSLKGEN